VLVGAAPGTAVFREAAEAAIVDPFTVFGTAFKVELAKRTFVRTLETAARSAAIRGHTRRCVHESARPSRA
jgi:xanthine dehydrogenase YagS FAD-binding subunit